MVKRLNIYRFSLNPGLWDLVSIKEMYFGSPEKLQNKFMIFDEVSKTFEQSFSVQMLYLGLNVAYLQVHFQNLYLNLDIVITLFTILYT